jgi:ActR/RegA family two-component response regulator
MAPKGHKADPTVEPMSEHARKLLIVEDDPGLLKQLKWCFEDYDVYTAEDREAAIAELRRHEPAVVLQDLGLPPKPEGVEEGLATLAETVRSHRRHGQWRSAKCAHSCSAGRLRFL